ncbi:Hypothetical predicted protein [Cloeon dipterum]|uniref:Uncharacterized protein n=1 Tax=Cloeon dipterum TaxID=197152 RepID=A0A8S1CXG4_9INSE|nr:Hypothetical predicted protein [Cloeon dipterum]
MQNYADMSACCRKRRKKIELDQAMAVRLVNPPRAPRLASVQTLDVLANVGITQNGRPAIAVGCRVNEYWAPVKFLDPKAHRWWERLCYVPPRWLCKPPGPVGLAKSAETAARMLDYDRRLCEHKRRRRPKGMQLTEPRVGLSAAHCVESGNRLSALPMRRRINKKQICAKYLDMLKSTEKEEEKKRGWVAVRQREETDPVQDFEQNVLSLLEELISLSEECERASSTLEEESHSDLSFPDLDLEDTEHDLDHPIIESLREDEGEEVKKEEGEEQENEGEAEEKYNEVEEERDAVGEERDEVEEERDEVGEERDAVGEERDEVEKEEETQQEIKGEDDTEEVLIDDNEADNGVFDHDETLNGLEELLESLESDHEEKKEVILTNLEVKEETDENGPSTDNEDWKTAENLDELVLDQSAEEQTLKEEESEIENQLLNNTLLSEVETVHEMSISIKAPKRKIKFEFPPVRRNWLVRNDSIPWWERLSRHRIRRSRVSIPMVRRFVAKPAPWKKSEVRMSSRNSWVDRLSRPKRQLERKPSVRPVRQLSSRTRALASHREESGQWWERLSRPRM